MKPETFGRITLYNADCMDVMREMPDKAFDLAIVDPPYGLNFGTFNRTIKFRGIDEETLEWVYGDLIHYDKWGDDKYTYQIRDRDGNHFNVIDKTVGQFTGLLDKNGREIWEDDVVKDWKGNVDTVNYDSITFNMCIAYASSPQGLCAGFFDNNPIDGIEVISNIHDHPELLSK